MNLLRNTLGLLSFVAAMACRPETELSDAKAREGSARAIQLKDEAYANLGQVVQEGRFLFGQQRMNLSGVGREGKAPWSDSSYGTEPDAQKLVGDQPAILGMDVWDFAMKNPTWNQPAYAKAAKDFYDNAKGGLVTFDWHMRACDVQDVTDAWGNRGVPGSGYRVDDWNGDSNRSCLCRIVNEEPWQNGQSWKDWLFTQKLDRFVTKLQSEGMDQMPMIFRPFHEMNGSWFWWGQKSWDCEKHLNRRGVITGVEAYKRLFTLTVDYMRNTRGLKNMLVAFSPDKLCKHSGHSCDPAKAANDTVSDQELYNDFMSIYPGKSYVDIVGLDLYYSVNNGNAWETPEYQSKLFARYLRTLSSIAKVEGKIAALTETGNYNLANEVNKSSEWFGKHLMPLLTGDKDIQLAYALTWENRTTNLTEYYIPYLGHAGYADFRNFAGNPKTMMLKDLGGLYSPNFGKAVPGKSTTPAREVGGEDQKPICTTSLDAGCRVATCQSLASDPDGDGWGWENNRTCKLNLCKSFASDPDGDGWGWEDNKSCQALICSSSASDPDGDGWGYENKRSCRVKSYDNARKSNQVYCVDRRSDPDGDGWGWENDQSCEIASCASQAADPDKDGWGVEYGHACFIKPEYRR